MDLGAKSLMAFNSTQAMEVRDLSGGERCFADIQRVVFPICK